MCKLLLVLATMPSLPDELYYLKLYTEKNHFSLKSPIDYSDKKSHIPCNKRKEPGNVGSPLQSQCLGSGGRGSGVQSHPWPVWAHGTLSQNKQTNKTKRNF